MLIPDLTISIVLYQAPLPLLERTLNALVAAVDFAVKNQDLGTVSLTLIANDSNLENTQYLANNDGRKRPELGHLQPIQYADLRLPAHPNLTIFWMAEHGNIGYGAANNLVLLRTVAPAHLVLNPDVEMAKECLSHGLQRLKAEPNTVLVSPVAQSPNGTPQYLAKRMPAVAVLFLRGFAPKWLLSTLPAGLKQRLTDYEYGDVAFDAPLENLEIASGAFMLLRTSAVQRLSPVGFDAKYFLYFEDFDLSLRLSKIGNIVREPGCKIVHAGGGAGKKGLKHIAYFARSAWRFFRRHK